MTSSRSFGRHARHSMGRPMIRSLGLAAIVWAAIGHRAVVSDDLTNVPLQDEMPPLVAALDAGICRWREVVEFAGHYRHRLAFALSEADALSWRFVDPETLQPVDDDFVAPNDPESADGFVAKRADAFRWKHIRITKVVRSGNMVVNAPFDLAVANGVRVEYRPPFGQSNGRRFGGAVEVTLIRQTGVAARFPPVAVSEMPLFAVAGSDEFRFRQLGDQAARLRWAYRQLAPSRVVVIVERIMAPAVGGDKPQLPTVGSRTHYFVRTDATYPVVERIESYYVDDGQTKERVTTTAMSDFVSCGPCLVPRRVVTTIRTLEPRKKGGPALWLARTWKSDDVGKRAPRDDDFTITVPKGTDVDGVRDRHRTSFPVLRMSRDDVVATALKPREAAPLGEEEPAERVAGVSELWSARVIGGIVLLAGVLLVAAGGRLAAASRER